MAPFFFKPFISLIGVVRAAENNSNLPPREWGTDFNWIDLENARSHAITKRKPIMVVIHKGSCPECGAFKDKFSGDAGIKDLAQKFIMVNLDADQGEVPNGDKFTPDGDYYPRILFFTQDVKHIQYACNMKNPDTIYLYNDALEVYRMMKQVLIWRP